MILGCPALQSQSVSRVRCWRLHPGLLSRAAHAGCLLMLQLVFFLLLTTLPSSMPVCTPVHSGARLNNYHVIRGGRLGCYVTDKLLNDEFNMSPG